MIRYALAPRWIAWHLLWAVAFVVCLRLAVWQYQAAVAPHPPGVDTQAWRNYAYSFNWAVFAGVAVWFWWRFMRDQRAADLAAEHSADTPEPPPVPAAPDPRDEPAAPGASSVEPRRRTTFDPFASSPGRTDDSAER